MSQPARLAFLVSTAALTAGVIIEGRWLLLIAVAANASFGWISARRKWESAWLVGQLALATLGGIPFLSALLTSAFGLAYWDLTAHDRLLGSADRVFGSEHLVRSHYRSLMVALLTGGFLAVIAIEIPVRLSFIAAILLALLAVAGIAALAAKARIASG